MTPAIYLGIFEGQKSAVICSIQLVTQAQNNLQ